MERELKWTVESHYKRFACTQCNWTHPTPSKTENPEAMDKIVLQYVERAFSSHQCASPH